MTRLALLVVDAFTCLAALALADAGQTRFPSSQRVHGAGGGNVYVRARCPRSAVDGCGGDVRLVEAIGEFATGKPYTSAHRFI
jgi:hypothetical protein